MDLVLHMLCTRRRLGLMIGGDERPTIAATKVNSLYSKFEYVSIIFTFPSGHDLDSGTDD